MTNHATITLTPAARRWALEQGGAITLRQSRRHGCCGGSALVPVAEIGEPRQPRDAAENRAEYIQEVVDGVRVFRSPSLATAGAAPITIDLAGLWRWRRLVVTGAQITADHEKAR